MSKDNYRPADYQITVHYKCNSCGAETEQQSCYGVGACSCGGQFISCGESYPADPDEWEEERDNYYSEWRRRR